MNSSCDSKTWAFTSGQNYPVTLQNNDVDGPTSGSETIAKNVLIVGTNATLQNVEVTAMFILTHARMGM